MISGASGLREVLCFFLRLALYFGCYHSIESADGVLVPLATNYAREKCNIQIRGQRPRLATEILVNRALNAVAWTIFVDLR